MSRFRVGVLVGLSLVLSADIGSAQRFRPPPVRQPTPTYKPPEPFRPTIPTYRPFENPVRRPGEPGYVPGNSGLSPHTPYQQALRQAAEQRYQAEVRVYNEKVRAYDVRKAEYDLSEKAFASASDHLKSGDLKAAMKGLRDGYTAAVLPTAPVPPIPSGLDSGVNLGLRRPSFLDNPLRTFDLYAPRRPTLEAQFRNTARKEFVKLVAHSDEPWKVLGDLTADTGQPGTNERTALVRSILADAVEACVERSLAVTRGRIEAGDWTAAVESASTAAKAINSQNQRKSGVIPAARNTFGEILTTDRGIAQATALGKILPGGSHAELKAAAVSDVTVELSRPVRAAVAATELVGSLGDKLPPADALGRLVADLRAVEPRLADRSAVELAGRCFVEGRVDEAHTLLGKATGEDTQPAAKALLRDLKAVVLGEGTVLTEVGAAAAALGSGGPGVRGPPAHRHLIPEGERLGYRPPVAEKASADLPPLGEELTATAAKTRKKAVEELGSEPERVRRRKTELAADLHHAGIPSDSDRLSQLLADRGIFQPANDRANRALDENEFWATVMKLLVERGIELTDELKQTVVAIRLRDRRLHPQDVLREAIGLSFDNGEGPYLTAVRKAVGRPLTVREWRVVTYFRSQKKSPEGAAAWVRGPAAAPRREVAPIPRAAAAAEVGR